MNATERLDEIEARAAGAHPGPWLPVLHVGGRAWIDMPDVDSHALGLHGWQPEAEFIAHARQDVPALVAALRAVLAVARRDLDESPDFEERLWDQGFNAALDDVEAAVTAALGGTP